ncbi:uncharacterized protein LOC106140132 isoform X2 [Amyelois transitella]|uniref:uncharacterized protein LOC106140132 isoform X2 n=1 Tax=Amyelois transitella TaxID=680683 RepID=UPI00298FD1A3|nr:uncharacterized protein LOC106140132 isoform X2 [Amyelois transitella]
MAVRYCVLLFVLGCVDAELCPKQCDCDSDNGLNRATCVDQNIISIEMGVPKGVQVYVLSHNAITELDNFCFKILNLNGCRIKSLPDRLFNRLPNLKKLDLSENYVMSLSLDVLRPLRKLNRLEFRNDNIKCTPDFVAVETWIVSREITYTKQCKKKMAKMSEKMVSVVVEKEAVDVNDVWNITEAKTTLPPELPEKPLTSFEKFDEDFSAFQAFIIGLELGLAIGVVGTYIWLRKFCKCGQLVCTRPERRRQGRRTRRTEGSDMRANLLWSTVINPELETPPPLRRELSLPERVAVFPPYGLPAAREAALRPDAVRLPDRAETPPPPYHECRINI